MLDYQLLEMYRCYLPYNVKTDKGILWALTTDGTGIIKAEGGEKVEYKLLDIKLHLNPIERLIEEVDEPYIFKTIPLIELAVKCEGNVIWEPKMKGFYSESGNFICGIKYRNAEDQYKVLTFSADQGFALQSTEKEDIIENRKTLMVSNIESVYEELYNLHMNIFDHKKMVNPLTKSKYIIKENVHTEEREKSVGIDL